MAQVTRELCLEWEKKLESSGRRLVREKVTKEDIRKQAEVKIIKAILAALNRILAQIAIAASARLPGLGQQAVCAQVPNVGPSADTSGSLDGERIIDSEIQETK
jgi:hypothetical protein